MSVEGSETGLHDFSFEFPARDENEENSVPVLVITSNADENAYQTNTVVCATDEQLKNQLPVSSILVENSVNQILVNSTSSNTINISVEETADDTINKKLSNYVYQVLSKTYEGRFQLACYDFELIEENKKKLLETKKKTYFSKNKVAKLIVNHEFYRTNDFHIPSERFVELAKLTVEVFPTLLPESFYSKANSNRSASGTFQSYYGKQREKEIALGRLKVPMKRKINEEEFTFEDLKILQCQVNIIDQQYITLWTKTASADKEELYTKQDLKYIVEKLPNLTHPLGYLLIDADFTEKYKKGKNLFLQNFSAIAPKLIAIAKSKRDAEIKQIISLNISTCTTEEQQSTLALVLLPYLFKRSSKITARSKLKANWTPNYHEIGRSFIIHLKETENLQESLNVEHNKLIDLCNDHKLILRPYVIIYGATLSNIQAAFVIAGPIKYQLNSVTSAIDICFKLHKVLHEPFSIICNHIWQFLEKKIYEFQVTNLYASVTTLIEKVN